MAEMAEVYDYSPSPPPQQNKTLQAWRTLFNWVAFLFHILVQIIRGTPSWERVLSYVRYRKYLLFSSDSADSSSAASVEFKPLPADIPLGAVESELSVSPHPSPPPLCPSLVCDDGTLEKLTFPLKGVGLLERTKG